ncbi:MAG TPA: outer membrane lipoprotein carrier protein LolA [Burkholderiaceae bacterium]|jgi:hypothetical protein
MRAFILALTLLAADAQAATDLAQSVRERLVQAPVLRGEFEQQKQVQGFAKPLISRGSFVVARERGVLWLTKTPFASQLRLTRDEIKATQNGAVAFRLDASKEPSVRVINGLMFSLLNGDIGGLSELFKVEGSAEGKAWQLHLTPRASALAKLMTSIDLSGEMQVRSITILEASGDKTVIRFSAQSAEPATLTAEEAHQFE